MDDNIGREIVGFFLADRESLLNSTLRCYNGIVDVIDFNNLYDLEEERKWEPREGDLTEEDILRYELYGIFDSWCQPILHVKRLDFIRKNRYDLIDLKYVGVLLYLGFMSFFFIVAYFTPDYSLKTAFPYAVLFTVALFFIKIGYILYLDNIYYKELKVMAKKLEVQEREYRKLKNIKKNEKK